uniref:Uncharacterized protein n=1 Tax=Glossina palpalis gambiensis TaxID=67801 RepID=A0A1B0BCU8_9MUSC
MPKRDAINGSTSLIYPFRNLSTIRKPNRNADNPLTTILKCGVFQLISLQIVLERYECTI